MRGNGYVISLSSLQKFYVSRPEKLSRKPLSTFSYISNLQILF